MHGLGLENLDSQNPCAGDPFRWLGRATETYFRFEVWASRATRHGFFTVSGLVQARRDSSLVLQLGRWADVWWNSCSEKSNNILLWHNLSLIVI